MAVNDIYRLTIKGRYDEQDCINVYHLHQTVAGDPDATPLGLASYYSTLWQTEMIPHLSANYTLQQVDCQRLRPTLSAIATSPVNPVVPGGLVGDSCPGTVAVVITLRTALGGKSRRGRTYICAPPENLTVMGKITEAYRALLSAGFSDFRAEYVDVANNTFRFVIYSTRSTLTPPHTVTPIEDHVVQIVMGNMRSRRIGRGT